MKPFLEDFPFVHYSVIGAVEALPEKVGASVLEWVLEASAA